jgi:hypothetical protein
MEMASRLRTKGDSLTTAPVGGMLALYTTVDLLLFSYFGIEALELIVREWDTPAREPWNPVIYQILRAIDLHNQRYFEDGDVWDLEKAEILRRYVRELKDRITI